MEHELHVWKFSNKILKSQSNIPNFMAEWLPPLLFIQKVSHLSLGTRVTYPEFSVDFLHNSWQMLGQYFKRSMTASFHTLFNSSFIKLSNH